MAGEPTHPAAGAKPSELSARRLSVMIVAGEASGDWLAAELVKALKLTPELRAMPFPPEFFGAGGPAMAAAGVDLAIELTRHSVTGLSEALASYPKFKRFLDQLVQLARDREPDLVICVDFSGFNRRFARAIRNHVRSRRSAFRNWNPRLVQYVSPQVWASRPGRARQLERDLDLLLSLFSFERDWYARHAPKLRVEFVGHPLVERYAAAARTRAAGGGAPGQNHGPQIVLLPGSRAAEVRRHLPVLLGMASRIRDARPDARFLMVLPNEELMRAVGGAAGSVANLDTRVGGLIDALSAADLAIAKSGTIALECAFFGLPAVVFYKTSWPSYLAGRMVVNVEYLAMPNLLAGEQIYPEFIQHTATPDHLARAALELLNDPNRRKAVKTKLARIVQALGQPGASARAARAILDLLPR